MAVKNFAVLEAGNVVNLILLDEDNVDYDLPDNQVLREAPDNVSIGWGWASEDWVAPTPPPMPDIPVEDPAVTAAKYSALEELTTLGVSEGNARIILGLPPVESE